MSNYTKIVIESDTTGRVNISALDEKNTGHGHRLAGRKYIEGGGKPLASVTLDSRDIDAPREYAAIWAGFTFPEEAELHALDKALRRYLDQLAVGEAYALLPHHVERRENLRKGLIDACSAAVTALSGPAGAAPTESEGHTCTVCGYRSQDAKFGEYRYWRGSVCQRCWPKPAPSGPAAAAHTEGVDR